MSICNGQQDAIISAKTESWPSPLVEDRTVDELDNWGGLHRSRRPARPARLAPTVAGSLVLRRLDRDPPPSDGHALAPAAPAGSRFVLAIHATVLTIGSRVVGPG